MDASAEGPPVVTTSVPPTAKGSLEERATGTTGRDSQRWLGVVDEIQRSEEAFREGLAVIEEVRARDDVLAHAQVFRQPLRSACFADEAPGLEGCFKGLSQVEGVSDALLAILRQPRSLGMTSALPLIRELAQRLPFLGLFVTFVASYPASATRIANLRQTSARFRITLAACEATPRAAKLSLETWLLTVVQRVPRWCLLLRRLQTCCDVPASRCLVETVDRGETFAVDEAPTATKGACLVASRLDHQLEDQQRVLEVLEIQRSVTGLSGSLVKPGRRLLRHGEQSNVRLVLTSRRLWPQLCLAVQ